MHHKWGIARKGLILISVPLLFQLGFLCAICVVLTHSQKELDRVSRSREIVAHADEVGRLMMQATALVAVHTFSGSEELSKRFDTTTNKIVSEYDCLQALLTDKPAELASLRRLREQTIEALSELTEVQKEEAPGTIEAALSHQTAKHVRGQSQRIGIALRSLVAAEEQLARTGTATRQKAAFRLKLTLILGLVASAAITLAMAMLFRRGIALRVKQVTENSAKLALRVPLLEPLAGLDEIALLDQAFHRADHDLRELEQVRRGLTLAIADRMQEPLRLVDETTRSFLNNTYGVLDERTRSRLERSLESSERLVRLVNDLRITENPGMGGRFELNMQTVDLSVILRSAVNALSEMAAEMNVGLELKDAKQLLVTADRDRLIQVAVNLISNAIKFSPAKGKIAVEARHCPDAGSGQLKDCVEFSVSDHGPGIPPEFQKRIFELFEQVDVRDSAVKGGSGLGLAICKDIVERHGGTIGVKSDAGNGCTFTVRLPTGRAVSPTSQSPAFPQEQA